MEIAFQVDDIDLLNLEKLVDIKEDELRQLYYDKYYPIFNDIIQFLKDKPALSYGGFALNEILPKKDKFYAPNELPDIDVLAVDAYPLTLQLLDYLTKKGYEYVSVGEALHEGTYKVFVEGLQVLDATNITKKLYERLAKNSVNCAGGLKCIDPEYLRMTLHVLMSQPVDSRRWTKVFQRMIAFYKNFPPQNDCPLIKSPLLTNREKLAQELNLGELDKSIYKWAKTNEYPIVDIGTIYKYLPKKNKYVKQLEPYIDNFPIQVLTEYPLENVSKNLENGIFKKYWKDISIKNVKETPFSPPSIIFLYKDIPILRVVKTEVCLSYITLKGQRYGSIQTLLRRLLEDIVVSRDKRDVSVERCIADALTYLSFEKSQNPILNPFVLKCYGPVVGQATMKREQIIRRLKKRVVTGKVLKY